MGVLVLVVPPMSPPPSLARLAVMEELKMKLNCGGSGLTRGIEVEEDVLGDIPADAASAVGDLDGDVVAALDDVDVNLWHGLRVLVELHRRPHAVLEHFEEHVVEMSGNVDKIDLVCALCNVGACDIHLRRIHVDLIAEEGSILVRLLGDLDGVALRVDGSLLLVGAAGVAGAALGAEQRLVVGDQHLDGDPGHVETVQEVLDGLVQLVLGGDLEIAIVPHAVQGVGHPRNCVLKSPD